MAVPILTIATATSAIAGSQDAAVTFNGYVPKLNDLVVLFPSSTTASATPTAPSGWVNPLGGTTDSESDVHEIACVYHLVTQTEVNAGTTTYTASTLYGGAVTGDCHGVVLRGVNPSDVVDGSGVANTTASNSATHVLAGIASTGIGPNNAAVISSVSKDGDGTYTALPAGWDWVAQSHNNQGRATLRRQFGTQDVTAVAATNITCSGADEYASISLALNAIASGSQVVANSTSFNYTTIAGDTCLVVGVAVGISGWGHPADFATRTATFNSLPMTSLQVVETGDGLSGFIELFYMINPPIGTYSVAVNMTMTGHTNVSLIAGAASFPGIGCVGAAVTNHGISTAPTVTVSSAATQTVVALIGCGANIGALTDTPIFMGCNDNLTACGNMVMQSQVGEASSVLAATAIASDYWGVIGVALRPPLTYTDACGGTDSVTTLFGFGRPVTDVLGLTDGVTATLTPAGEAYTETDTDTLDLVDDAAASQGFLRDVTDPLGGLDAVTVVADYVRTATDAAGLTDTATSAVGRTVIDALGGSDAATRVADVVQAYTDAAGLSDAATIEVGRSVTDALGGVDALTRVATAVRDFTDGLGLSDTVTVNFGANITDALDGLDSASTTLGFARAATNALGITDAAICDLAGANEISKTDALGLTDTLTTAALHVPTDQLGLSDSVSCVLSAAGEITFTDDLEFTDTIATAAGRTATDDLGATDSVTTASGRPRTASDALRLTDGAAAAVDLLREPTDTAGLIDSIECERIQPHLQYIDTLGLADEFTAELARGPSPIVIDLRHAITVCRSRADQTLQPDSRLTQLAPRRSQTVLRVPPPPEPEPGVVLTPHRDKGVRVPRRATPTGYR